MVIWIIRSQTRVMRPNFETRFESKILPGRTRHLTPGKPSEHLPVEATQSEAAGYERFVGQYNQYFMQFFDPIGFVFAAEPDFRARLMIMPLVENGIYTDLQKNLRQEPMKSGPQLKNGILEGSSCVSVQTFISPEGLQTELLFKDE